MPELNSSKIGFVAALATMIGLNMGGGLWSTPAIAGSITGSSAVGSMLLAAVPLFLAFPAYFTLSKVWPTSPGHYYYPSRVLVENETLGHLIGWLVGWTRLIVEALLSYTFMVLGGAAFLHLLVPSVPRYLFVVGLLTVAFGTVWFGLRVVGWIEIGLVVLLLATVAVFVVGGLPHVDPANLSHAMPNGFVNFLSSIGIVYILAAGGLGIIDVGGEIDDASNTIGKVLLYGIGGVVLIDALVTLVVVGAVPFSQLGGKTLSFVAGQYFSTGLTTLVGLGAVVAGLSTVLAILPMHFRFYMAMAEDNLLPDWINTRNRYGEPIIPLIGAYVLAVATAYFNLPLGTMAAGFVFPLIGMMILVSLAGFRLPTTHPEIFERESLKSSSMTSPTVVRWSSFLAVVTMTVMFAFLAYKNQQPFQWFLIIMAAGVAIYVVRLLISGSDDLLPESSRLGIPGRGEPAESD